MRWFWIDRFTEFVRAERASALKAVSITEELLDEYFPGFPVMSPTFVIEGFAQMGGLLIGERTEFKANIVLAKVGRSQIVRYPRPGELLKYQVQIQGLQPDGGQVTGSAEVDGQLIVQADLTFAQVSRMVKEIDFFDPAEFLRMLRIYRLYDVGVDQQGKRLQIPDHLLAAERAAAGSP